MSPWHWINSLSVGSGFLKSFEASPEQLEEARTTATQQKKTSAKSKAAPKRQTKPPKADAPDGKADKHPRSPPKADQASPNPCAMKRMKGKQADPDTAKQLEELRQA